MSSRYPFDLIHYDDERVGVDPSLLLERPFTKIDRSLEAGAQFFVPGEELETAINVAIAVGDPLLITGEPGTGKTQAAYYVARKLGLELIHFQVKSDSTARDLLYHFDTVRYFYDAQMSKLDQPTSTNKKILDKADYVEQRALYEAFTKARERNEPLILLLDEIDKAPRDFPNDLLHELDQMNFKIPETGQEIGLRDEDKAKSKALLGLKPIIFITSNSERRLPEPFLRRCIYHHIEFNPEIVRLAVRVREREYRRLSDHFLQLALDRFFALRDRQMRKKPATGELLVWLRVLSLTTETELAQLEEDLSEIPFPGVLIKDHQDLKEIQGSGAK